MRLAGNPAPDFQPARQGGGFTQGSLFNSTNLANAGSPSIVAWAGTLTAVQSSAGSLMAGVLPGIDAASPSATANASSSGVRVSTLYAFVDTTAGPTGKPTGDIVFAVSTAHNSNNRFFVGFLKSITFGASPLGSGALDVHFGFGFDAGTSRLSVCGYDGTNVMTPVDTGHDLAANTIYRGVFSFSSSGFRGQLFTSPDFRNWRQVAQGAWQPPGSIATNCDVGAGFANAASAGTGIIRGYSIGVRRV